MKYTLSTLLFLVSVTACSSSAPNQSKRDCHGTGDPRQCSRYSVYPVNHAASCFEATVTIDDFCMVCTMDAPSGSIGPVCAVDPHGTLYVLTMRPDLRMEMPGWRFGHRRDRNIYRDLEADLLTPEESTACDGGAALWFKGGFESDRCAKDAGNDRD